MQWTWSLKTRKSSEAENIPGELMCEKGKTGYLQRVCGIGWSSPSVIWSTLTNEHEFDEGVSRGDLKQKWWTASLR